ncbi:class I SAM-dependent methyltransferase [Loktanella sp. R86503]|uniref:class I SAM-dependent methyltransferase n=1 Tax=Loktanella sp. R86503 TaxID=3093847 RepID=UPI0036DF6A22
MTADSNDSTLDVPTFEIGDRISDAYYGSMGDAFARKVRQRVHWIAEQVQGHAVLDIGCSQGIGCILLGREGHVVEGVDIDANAIARAGEYLAQEPESVRRNVTFRNADFMGADFDDRRFSTIVMGEVLEHLVRPQVFVARAYDLLEEGGRIVVTVPFGINDFPDHKRTFYLAEMTRLLHPAFDLSQPRYFGRWIGFVGTRRNTPVNDAPSDLTIEATAQLEGAFYKIERELVDRVVDLKAALADNRTKMQAKARAAAAQTDRAIADLEAKRAAEEKKVAALAKDQAARLQDIAVLGLKLEASENIAKNHADTIAALQKDKAEQARKIASLTKDQTARLRDIAVLGLRLGSAEQEARAFETSTSWKVTRPLRAVVRRLRRGR